MVDMDGRLSANLCQSTGGSSQIYVESSPTVTWKFGNMWRHASCKMISRKPHLLFPNRVLSSLKLALFTRPTHVLLKRRPLFQSMPNCTQSAPKFQRLYRFPSSCIQQTSFNPSSSDQSLRCFGPLPRLALSSGSGAMRSGREALEWQGLEKVEEPGKPSLGG